MAAIDLWLSYEAHAIVVKGPRLNEITSWDRMNERASQHLQSYFDAHPELLLQLRYMYLQNQSNQGRDGVSYGGVGRGPSDGGRSCKPRNSTGICGIS